MRWKESKGCYVNAHSCFLLQYHLVLVTKFRNPVIYGDLKEDLYALVRSSLEERGLVCVEVGGGADHLHVLFEADPQTRLSELVNVLKSRTSRAMRRNHPNQVRRYYWKPFFWSLSYFLCTVSDRSWEAVERYIHDQTVQ